MLCCVGKALVRPHRTPTDNHPEDGRYYSYDHRKNCQTPTSYSSSYFHFVHLI